MALPAGPAPGTLAARAWNRFTDVHIFAFRLTRGRVGGRVGKAPILLLHHVGRKSGQHRVNPLICVREGDRVAIVASYGGAPKAPAWYHNLMASPDAEIELPGERRKVRAREVTHDPERAELWAKAVSVWPDYAVYQSRTDRLIPVVSLDPR